MVFVETDSVDAGFHFSVEEYILKHYPFDEPVMMIWQTGKCVMLGRNQIADAEIDTSYARRAGIGIVRRSSGGGTIFADLGTLLYTVIQPCVNESYPLEIAKETVIAPFVDALTKMGIPARVDGRNDILLDGKKISGFAQYVRFGRICTHCSLLYDTDLEELARVLRADEEKIRSKALQSVRSRVVNVKEHMGLAYSTKEFRSLLKQNIFFSGLLREHSLSDSDLTEIDKVFQEKYGNPSWTHEQSPGFSFHNSRRFAGGRVEVYLDVAKGVVSSCSIRGDFLGVVPIRGLEKAIEGKLFQYRSISEAVGGIALQPYLGDITGDEFLSCFFDE